MLALTLAALLQVETLDGAVVLKQDGAEVLRYQTEKPSGSKLSVESACYFHPLTTPKGTVITDVAPDDHKHHRGVFFAWVEMHGAKDADFWGWGQHAPKDRRRVVHRESKEDAGALLIRNDWVAEDTVVMREEVRATSKTDGDLRVVDLAYTLTPEADTAVARWAFSGFVVRTRKDGKITAEGPDGEVKRPSPKHTDPASNWPDAPWYAFSMELKDGAKAGVAVVNHPKNLPTSWHVVKGIGMLNPAVCAPAALSLKAKEPVVLRYRVVTFDGALPRERLNALAAELAR
ncbi:MAG TPA: DUF6807 family protein [Planctomycetota bacterium]|nr:DUF6807 family protein [Planctomycetota bacterium]